MNDDSVLLTEYSDGLARITINRPHRLNTMNRELLDALRREFLSLVDRRDIRVVHLTASGDKSFCAGADLKEPDTHEFADLGDFLQGQPAVFDTMAICPQVIVTEVNGWAIGGGMQLALFSDLVYASAGATFQLPQVKLGLVPPYGVGVRLAKYIGQGRALGMILRSQKMTAEQALDWGFVQDVAPDAESLRRQVDEVLQSLLALPQDSLQLAKESLVHGWDMSAQGAVLADRYRSYALKQSAQTKQLHHEWREGS